MVTLMCFTNYSQSEQVDSDKESSKESADERAQAEDSVQASIDNKKLKLAMKKRKSNYNAIMKKRNEKKNDTTDVDSFLRSKFEDTPEQMLKSQSRSKTVLRDDSPANLNDKELKLRKPLSFNPDNEGLPEIPLSKIEVKDSKDSNLQNLTARGPKDSTGGSGQNSQEGGRKDRYGNKILRGKKKHKVTFKDQVGKGKVAKVHFVESYKKYNVESTTNTCS